MTMQDHTWRRQRKNILQHLVGSTYTIRHAVLISHQDNSKKIDPVRDPFFSTDIRPGVNLNSIPEERRKNAAKNASPKKPPVEEKEEDKDTYEFLKVTLTPKDEEAAKRLPGQICSILSSFLNKEEDRGDLFYDTEGKAVGHTNDFIINRCRVTKDGWMVLPGVDPSLFTSSGGASSDEASSSHYAMGGEK
ncbi:hypothetical protein TNCV_1255561 [Trichonephila clavipes]|nr:hypothetical protein TNCV_1255561 [Trichonephila clavipes]